MTFHFSAIKDFSKRSAADVLIVPCAKGAKGAELLVAAAKEFKLEAAHLVDFKGDEDQRLKIYQDKSKEPRVVFIGLGKKENVTVESLRRAYGAAAKKAIGKGWTTVNMMVPTGLKLTDAEIARAVSEGVTLVNYSFDKLRNLILKDKPTTLLKHVTFVGMESSGLKIAEEAAIVARSVNLARDLINGNADDVTPQFLVKTAQEIAKKHKSVKTTILDKKKLEKEQMGLILAVARGSIHEPALIYVEYKGAPKSKDHTYVVGKGVTYDTGGLNLKPTGSMETMKDDMSGGAAALAIVQAAAELGLKVNVTAVVPTVENAIGSRAYKPGDVYKAYTGKTVEINNTDAEGRLILADALAYTVEHHKPTRIIDFATLTGAMVIALGDECSGMFSNNDHLAESLYQAGKTTHERVWRLPNFKEYRELLKSDVADMKNCGTRAGGSITAAKFLEEFVGETPWAHLDIAGTAFLEKPKRYLPQFGTGVGVRLVIEFLKGL